VNLLVDTQILLWSAFRSERLPKEAAEMLSDESNFLWVSAASIWEIAMKRALNKRDFQVDVASFRAGLLRSGYEELPIKGIHSLSLGNLPLIHSDPFDRLLLAQAISEGMMLLTADTELGSYQGPIHFVKS
jgi:PIN domain nuclease of toxin-antitoxin system